MMNEDHESFILSERLLRDHADKLERLQARRQTNLLFLCLIVPVLCLCLTPLLVVVSLAYTGIAMPYWFAAIMSLLLVLSVAYTALDASYRHKAKHDMLYMIAAASGMTYRRGGFITLGDLYDHHVLPPYAQSESEEGFAGTRNGIKFQFQDFRIQPVMRLHWFDLRSYIWSFGFYGVAFRIDLGRHLDFHTILMPNFMAAGASKRLVHEKFQAFDDINLVYTPFKDRYTVLSTDQVEARYVLDPAMMERFMALKDLLDASWLEVSFRGRELVIIAGQTRNFFEIGHLLNPVNVLTVEDCLKQLDRLGAVVEALDLNTMTGLGRYAPRFPRPNGE